jgi:uncharacterized membrane protein YeaQ/YmgE (transglycosylase-associated protein family)
MGWILTLVIGGVVGWLLGFWGAGLLGIAPTSSILRFGVALVGAAALIFILRSLGVFRRA